MATNIPPPGPLTYEGQVVTPFIRKTTSPTTANNGFPVPTIWINTSLKKAWILVNKALGIADWVPIGGDPGEVETLTVDAFTGPGTNPVVPDSNASITVTGGQVAAGTTTHVIRTDSLAANTYTIEIQRSQAVASSTVGDNGVSHFDSSQFSVDSNGFVSMPGVSGNFTPGISFGGGTTGITYGDQEGQYTRVANMIFFSVIVTLTNKGSSTGNARITGFPVAMGGISTQTTYAETDNITYPAGCSSTFTGVAIGNTYLTLNAAGSATAFTALDDTNFANNSVVRISGFYFTS